MINFSSSVVNDRLTAFTRGLDGGGSNAKLMIFDGTKPIAGDPHSNTKLVEFTLPYPSLLSITSGTLTLANPDPTEAVANGTATWARFVDSNGQWVADVTVGGVGSGSVIQFSGDAMIYSGGVVTISLAVMSEG